MFTDREKKVAGLNVVNDNDMIKTSVETLLARCSDLKKEGAELDQLKKSFIVSANLCAFL